MPRRNKQINESMSCVLLYHPVYQNVCIKVRSHSLSSCKNLLHTTFGYVQLFCSYSKTSCMKHSQFSIKICHSSSIYCNSVCPGDSKLRELSLNHTMSSPLWVRALVGSNVETKRFCCGSGWYFFLGISRIHST